MKILIWAVAILCEYDYIKSLRMPRALRGKESVVAILCEYDYIKRMPLKRNTKAGYEKSQYSASTIISKGTWLGPRRSATGGRNTLRVRLYQKNNLYHNRRRFMRQSQYSASTIISKEYLWKPLSGKGSQGKNRSRNNFQLCQGTICCFY